MSSTTFNREDCIFGVSYNKPNDKWKQTVFSDSCLLKISPGHEVSVAIKQESLPTFGKHSVLCLVRYFGVQALKVYYTANCQPPCSPKN